MYNVHLEDHFASHTQHVHPESGIPPSPEASSFFPVQKISGFSVSEFKRVSPAI